MKGIKTAVKTDWKNYMHGNTREMFLPQQNFSVYATGLKKDDMAYLSYHAEWKGLKGEKAFKKRSIFQMDYIYDYALSGPYIETADGEKDVMIKLDINKHFGGVTDVVETDKCGFFMHSNDWGISFEEGGYMKLTNIMLSKNSPMPYIDSDELKAEGGAISKALIVALHLSEERRAA